MPTEKRARHKAARQAKMAELRRAQQRRRNMKRGGVVGIFVVIALVLALYSGGIFGSKKQKTATSSPPSSAASTTTASTTPPTTTPLASVKPLSVPSLEAALNAQPAPARSKGCNASDTGTKSSGSTTTTTIPAKGNAVSMVAAPAGVGFPKLDGSSPRYTKFSSAPPFCINTHDVYLAKVRTTAGTMTFELLPKYAPVTVNSFVFLAGYHFFDGIVFHRVIPGFVDQTGDPTGTGTGGPGYEFKDELPKSTKAYDAGALAMANSGANTNGSQFFVTVGNGGQGLGKAAYSEFGQVTSGLAVADKINAGGAASGTPTTLYRIKSISITAKRAG